MNQTITLPVWLFVVAIVLYMGAVNLLLWCNQRCVKGIRDLYDHYCLHVPDDSRGG